MRKYLNHCRYLEWMDEEISRKIPATEYEKMDIRKIKSVTERSPYKL